MLSLYDTWTNIKNILDNNEVVLQYLETPDVYKISVVHEQNNYITELWINTDKVRGIDVTQNNLDRQDFEDNYKNAASGIVNATGGIEVGGKTVETIAQLKKAYRCKELDVEAAEQEYDLEAIYTDFSIMVSGSADVIIKLNNDANDEIPLKGGQNIRDIIGVDTFELTKIYYKTNGSGITSKILLFATKR